jgi:hypothetical protein
MPIIGDRPETGIRFVLERPARGEAPWIYEGHAFLPDAEHALHVTVTREGEVRVVLDADAPAGVAEKVRLLFRSLYKASAEGAGAPPRKVVRWRGEK